jgi:hypothetical protein
MKLEESGIVKIVYPAEEAKPVEKETLPAEEDPQSVEDDVLVPNDEE